MDYNLSTLEIADLIFHFDYFDKLILEKLAVTDEVNAEEQNKMRHKNREHVFSYFTVTDIYTDTDEVRPLQEIKNTISLKLQNMKAKEIHELIAHLEKDEKKIKKLYKLLRKKS